MEAQQAVEMDSAAPSGAEASPAESTYQETGGQEGQEGGQQTSGGEDQAVQQPSKADRRYQKLANEVRTLREERAKYEDAINFHNIFRQQNPEALSLLIQLSQGLLEKKVDVNQITQALQSVRQASVEEKYADYDPVIRDALKQNESLAKELADLKQWKESSAQEREQGYLNSLSAEFDRVLERDGYITPEGEYDEAEYYALTTLTRSLLTDYAKNPKQPTVEEMNRAYGLVKQFLNKQSGKALSKVVKKPTVPPSGSRKGAPLVAGSKNRALSHEEMAAMLED